MNQLIDAYQCSIRKRNVLFKWLIVFFVFSCNVWTLKGSYISFPLGLILSLIVGGVLMWYLYARTRKAKDFLLHRLIEPGDLNCFLNTIDYELQSPTAISIRDDISGMSLFVTETWIILFSTGTSFIRQVKNLVTVESVFHETRSRTAIHFIFSNGESFGCFCNEEHDEIRKLFSREEGGTQS